MSFFARRQTLCIFFATSIMTLRASVIPFTVSGSLAKSIVVEDAMMSLKSCAKSRNTRVLKRVADGREAVPDDVEVIAGLVARDDRAGVVSQFLDLVHGLVSFLSAPGGSFHMQTL